MKEKLFGLISLAFLTVGFIVGVAGADKDGPKDLANATDQLIHHVSLAKEAEEINRPQVVMAPSNLESVSQQKIVLVTDKTKTQGKTVPTKAKN